MKKVIILGKECTIEFGRYRNKTIAMTAKRNGRDWLVITVNYESGWQGATPYAKTFVLPAVVIKNYSENEGVVKDLVDGGVISRGVYMGGTNGTVEVCSLTPDWQEEAKRQLAVLDKKVRTLDEKIK